MKFTNGKYSKIIENYHFIPKRGYSGTIGNFPPNSNLFNVVQRKTGRCMGEETKEGEMLRGFPRRATNAGWSRRSDSSAP